LKLYNDGGMGRVKSRTWRVTGRNRKELNSSENRQIVVAPLTHLVMTFSTIILSMVEGIGALLRCRGKIRQVKTTALQQDVAGFRNPSPQRKKTGGGRYSVQKENQVSDIDETVQGRSRSRLGGIAEPPAKEPNESFSLGDKDWSGRKIALRRILKRFRRTGVIL